MFEPPHVMHVPPPPGMSVRGAAFISDPQNVETMLLVTFIQKNSEF